MCGIIDFNRPYLVSADDGAVETGPSNGKYFELEEVQLLVGGYIEVVRLSDKLIMIVNENGKIEGLNYNFIATRIAEFFKALRAGDYICGDAVVCPSSMLP